MEMHALFIDEGKISNTQLGQVSVLGQAGNAADGSCCRLERAMFQMRFATRQTPGGGSRERLPRKPRLGPCGKANQAVSAMHFRWRESSKRSRRNEGSLEDDY